MSTGGLEGVLVHLPRESALISSPTTLAERRGSGYHVCIPLPVEQTTRVGDDGRLTIAYAGGLADAGALLLSEYSASLHGWRDLAQFLGELYLHSFPELRRIRGTDLLRIEV